MNLVVYALFLFIVLSELEMTTSTKIRVSNDRSAFVTLWLEPWAEDYGMLPNDEFEVIALGPEETFYFHIECGTKGMKIYAEGDVSQVSVYQNGEILACGHDRREEEW